MCTNIEGFCYDNIPLTIKYHSGVSPKLNPIKIVYVKLGTERFCILCIYGVGLCANRLWIK